MNTGAKTTTNGNTMRLKLMIDAPGKRVVFAEAGKDFVDFLFCILSLPVAKVIGVLGQYAALGSVENLRRSTENLKPYFLPTADTLLKPAEDLSSLVPPPEKAKCSQCSTGNNPYLGSYPCGACQILERESQKRKADGGFVKDMVAYMVTDDLTVMPLSTASAINVMNKHNVKRLVALEERVVNFTMDEANKFLKASLESKSVLTNFFLKDTCGKGNGPPRSVKREVPILVEDDDTAPRRTSRAKKERTI